MIKLFISDIDGCLSEPYQAMDLTRLSKMAAYAKQGGQIGSHAEVPALSLCSGRPMPYVECMSQLLGIQVPVLFESGGGIFDPSTASVIWSPHLTEDVELQVREVTRWFEKECVLGTSMIVDYAKRAHAGIIGPDPEEILAAIPRVKQFIVESGLPFKVLPTYLSIDVVPAGITKEEGLNWMISRLGLELSEVAYIGDSMGDFGTLQIVGTSFAPGNAKDLVKEEVNHVVAPFTAGVVEAFELCIAGNRQGVEIEELI